MTSAIGSDAAAPVLASDGSAAPPPTQGSRLPEPEPLSANGLNDMMSMLYVAIARLRDSDILGGRLRAEENATLREKALADEKAALERERANQSNSGDDFFSSVGKLVGDIVDDIVHLRLADAANDAGSDVSAAWNSPKFWSDLESGFKDVALLSDAVAEAAAQVGGTAGGAVAAAAATVSEWAAAGAALAHARGEHFAAEALDAHAGATNAQHGIERLNRVLKWLTDELRAVDKSHQRALQSINNAIRTVDETLLVTVSVSVRG